MTCVAADWILRGKNRYRSCYDDRGTVCCRADVIESRPGEWLVKVRQGKRPAVSYGTWLSRGAAFGLANAKLGECGCSGTGIALGGLCKRR